MKLQAIAERLGCQLVGDGSIEIHRVAGLEEAGPGDLTFLSNSKYQSLLRSTRASAIIISKDAPPVEITTLRTPDPYLAFAQSIDLFYFPPEPRPGIHPTAVISKTAQLGRNPRIGPFCFVDEAVSLGDNAVLYSHVVIYRGVRIGNDFVAHSHVSVREYSEIGERVILQNGVVVGADGFGFAKTPGLNYRKITQSGRVILEDDVEVQANSTLDRAAIGETRIRRGAKIDNLVQVGHGSCVGENSLLCAQVGLAGSTKIGKNVILTGQVGVAGHCTIGDNVVATAQTGIPSDVAPGRMVSGYPAMDNKRWLKCSVLFSKLPEISRSLSKIQQTLDHLISKGSSG
ncbi:MAG: UDP-3-O-(3-hydroxymyristoyl)glucosamine N-acyltransferase [Acidobacteria bacterium]|nr:UDP-3-O-(3-hydroxymyristoyl)glucosamine N-acyltransferase [Acidobacteriota bacterium]MCI0628149.1 UDP-3-O-(3-hydroxymyristoyl)glucosamine N-acyltransferase [Acidobacteriota bacterium]MCI0721572.1 UDP-3-O-(3-hydroxymyristoyl)glucosamine N-acyltransferase [Acidobacteriota bacterium]